MQDFLVSLAKILVILAFVAKNSNNFQFSSISFSDLGKSFKFLRNLPRIIPKILARNAKIPKNFLARKPRRQALGRDNDAK